jgi:hypothetical protein
LPLQQALNHYPLPDADRKALAVWLFEKFKKGKKMGNQQ